MSLAARPGRPCSRPGRSASAPGATSSAMNRSPRPIGSLASMRKQTTSTSPSVASARLFVRSPSSVRGLWIPGVSRNTICVVVGRAHAADLRARRLRPVETIDDLAADELVHERRLPDVGPADDRRRSPNGTRSSRVARGVGVATGRLGDAASRVTRIRTDTMRRPCTRSAQNSSPSTRAHSPSIGHVAERVEHQPADGVPLARRAAPRRAARSPRRSACGPGTRSAPPASCSTCGSSTSYSSVISPTISSSRSSIVTSPAVPPYSSMTIAMWNFSVCISRSSSATRFDSGTKCAGRSICRTGSLPSPLPLRVDEVLQEHEADDVVGRLVVRGEPRLARRDRDADRLVDRRVGVDRDHVGPRHHHLAHDRVAELEDRVDELALLGLDRRLLARRRRPS